MQHKPLSTIQAEARVAFDEQSNCIVPDCFECTTHKAFLDTQLSLAYAAGKEGGREDELNRINNLPTYLMASPETGKEFLFISKEEVFGRPDTEEKN